MRSGLPVGTGSHAHMDASLGVSALLAASSDQVFTNLGSSRYPRSAVHACFVLNIFHIISNTYVALSVPI